MTLARPGATGHAGGDHDHSHGGAHGHHHHLPSAGRERAFALAVALNLAIVVLQTIYGILAHSTALLADAGHNLSDVLGLLLAWGAIWLSKRQASARYTFGLRGSSILAALANAMVLLFACGVIAWEALDRFSHPAPVAGVTVFVVALIGLVINGFSAWLFVAGSKDDLNVRGAFLHMAADAGFSAAVALSGLVILATGWFWIDPMMSLIVVAAIIWGSWGILRDSIRLALGAVPAAVDTREIENYLLQLPGVAQVCDLHAWGLSTTENSLTVHLVMPAGHPGDAFLDQIATTLQHKFAIHHVTIQINLTASAQGCVLDHAPT